MTTITNIFNPNSSKPLILDGAMGSLLQMMGIKPHPELWMSYANLSNPDIVISAHKQYIDAGAEIITTNTFRTNPAARKSLPTSEQKTFVNKSVQLAKDAKSNSNVLIAGSNAPAEDCYQVERTLGRKELVYNHHRHISELMESGVNFVLNETQSHTDEIEIVCEYCSRNNIPFVISLFFTEELKLLSGEKISEALTIISDFNPMAISFNCITGKEMDKLIGKNKLELKWGFYLNCGTGNYSDPVIESVINPEEYISGIKNYFDFSPVFAGACCGSTPEHINQLKKYLNERNQTSGAG
ncbi:MAG: hypothetical protein Kow0098_08140 [Ignavibacteriaceae bacterium]